MMVTRLIPVIVILLLAVELTAYAQTGATPTGRTETVTAIIDGQSPIKGTRYLGTVVAVRTEMRDANGETYLDTEWTLDATAAGKPVKLTGRVREFWFGTARALQERIEIVDWPKGYALPVSSVTLTQTRPNVINVGGLATLAIDGWLQPPFSRAAYRVTPAGRGSTSIGSLPGGNTQVGGAPLTLPATGGDPLASCTQGWLKLSGD